MNLQEERKKLPIFGAREALLKEIASTPTLIVVGQTGSGKTTQIPQYIHESQMIGDGKVAITQPRRVAAITIARRVALEMETEVGIGTVGYSVRFEDCTSANTKVKYMTDGMLLREAMLDSNLLEYNVIILDEAHERTLHTDILFGLVKTAQKQRIQTNRPLKVIIMSATLDAELFSKYFDCAKVVWIEGRQFPVDIFYTTQPEIDYLDAALTTVMQIHVDEKIPGDILVFLTGQEEIESLGKMVKERVKALPPNSPRLIVCPIFAALPGEQQMKAFEKAPLNGRKVILATNIAETSITIPGVKFVVDTGVVKARGFNNKIGIDTLSVVPISKAQARQRAGRAGREGPGICYRLFTEISFDNLIENTIPEIKRCNLSTVVLQLKSLGIEDIVHFDYIQPPPLHSLKRALETLICLHALDEKMQITDLGKKTAQFPLDPQYAVILIKSNQNLSPSLQKKELRCSEEALSVVSMLSAESVFFSTSITEKDENSTNSIANTRRRFASILGDQLTMLAVYKEYKGITKDDISTQKQWCKENSVDFKTMIKVENVRQQLEEYFLQLPGFQITSCNNSFDLLRRALTSGLFMHAVSLRPDKVYRTILNNTLVNIHPSSVLFGIKPLPSHLIYNELILTKKPYMRDIFVIEAPWLIEFAPHLFSTTTNKSTK